MFTSAESLRFDFGQSGMIQLLMTLGSECLQGVFLPKACGIEEIFPYAAVTTTTTAGCGFWRRRTQDDALFKCALC